MGDALTRLKRWGPGDAATGYLGPLVIHLERTLTSAEAIRELSDAVVAHGAARAGKVVFFNIVDPRERTGSLPRPDESQRRAWSELASAIDPHVLGAAVIIIGSGFRASILRAITAGILLLARHRKPVKVFDGVPACEPYLRELLGTAGLEPPGLPAILAAVEALRQAADQAVAAAT